MVLRVEQDRARPQIQGSVQGQPGYRFPTTPTAVFRVDGDPADLPAARVPVVDAGAGHRQPANLFH